jgi:putative ABC transport system ATP-binding protein
MIQFKHIEKTFSTPEWDIPILKDASVHVTSWEFMAIMWPSGSGKTTFLNLIAGLVRPDWWTIEVHQQDIVALSRDEMTMFRWKHISFVFQQFHLLPQLTAQENVDLVIQLNKLERRFSTQEILEKVGLKWRGHAYPSTLSWGEQQRVAVARAFVWNTPILLADEPTGNLDQKTAHVIMDLMTQLHKQVNNTIVMITHDKDIASYADTTYQFQDHALFPVSNA